MFQCKDYRIGKTVATMVPLPWHELPYPIQDSYKPFSIAKVCGNMSAKGYGYPSTVWSFSALSQDQMAQVFALFDEPEDASTKVYIRTFKDIGGLREIATFYATMYRPIDGSGAVLVPNSAFRWVNVQLRFAHLEEQ